MDSMVSCVSSFLPRGTSWQYFDTFFVGKCRQTVGKLVRTGIRTGMISNLPTVADNSRAHHTLAAFTVSILS